MSLRPPKPEELPAASALCLRSKAYWGYDEDFMAACVSELTLTTHDMKNDPIIVAEDERGLAGVAHVKMEDGACYLEKLFVDTDRMGKGVGRLLYNWALEAARRLGAEEVIVEADPDAVPFYERMGCLPAGEAPSGSIPGRVLPRLVHPL